MLEIYPRQPIICTCDCAKKPHSVNYTPHSNLHQNATPVFPCTPLKLFKLKHNQVEYFILKQHITDISMKPHTCEMMLHGENANLQLTITERTLH